MIVQNIMTTNIKTVFLDQPVKDIALMMIMDHISGAPVVDVVNNLVGIISEKDILRHIFPELEEIMSDTHFDFENMEANYKDTMNVKISEIMTEGVVIVLM